LFEVNFTMLLSGVPELLPLNQKVYALYAR
jgi:hypothetical protein